MQRFARLFAITSLVVLVPFSIHGGEPNAAIEFGPPKSSVAPRQYSALIEGNAPTATVDGQNSSFGPNDSSRSLNLGRPNISSAVNGTFDLPAEYEDSPFERYVDLRLLHNAMATHNASLMVDLALQLAEGERILLRCHKCGLTARKLLQRATKMAGSTGDKATLARLIKAADLSNDKDLGTEIQLVQKLGSTSRAASPAFTVSLEDTSVETLVEMKSYLDAFRASSLAGDKEELLALRKQVESSKQLTELQKSSLTKELDRTIEKSSNPTEDDLLLLKLAGQSRADYIKNTPFDPRTHHKAIHDTVVGVSNAAQSIGGQGFYRFHVRNASGRQVWVAVFCLKNNGFGDFWATLGWWKLQANETAYLTNSKNRYFSYYAHDEGGAIWSGNNLRSVWDKPMPDIGGVNVDMNTEHGAYQVGFLQVDMGSQFCDYTAILSP